MLSERPPIHVESVLVVMEDPDSDDGSTAIKRHRHRTVIVRYEEQVDRIVILSVSATRRRLPPRLP